MDRPTIHRLDEATVARIAAGEVITRPVRVVAELLDNALDAGAGRIEITVDGDGTERIRVADDGCGLSRADAERAVERHATSKLPAETAADLTGVSTLGFRGEALAAIADCATLELVTNDGEAVGTKLRIEDGEVTVTNAGRAQGTTVTVTDLFADRPARRESLAEAAAEFGRISELVARYALARPAVRFSLTHNGTETLSASGSGLQDALLGVYDAGTASRSTTIHHETSLAAGGDLSVDGICCYPSVTRATREHVRVSVGGRPVTDTGLRQAVLSGYGSLVAGNRYPVAAIDVDPPAGTVDPNVHPAKEEVGLTAREAIETAVERAVSEALTTADIRRTDAAATDLETELRAVDRADPFGEVRVIGPFRDLYLLCEDGDELLVVDQHAAHERVNYERLRATVADEGVPTAPLDPPETVSVGPGAAAAAETHADLLADLGFDVEPFGGGTLRVSGLPAPLGRVAETDALVETLDRLAAGHQPDDRRDALLSDLACHPSLKAGDRLTTGEAEQLLERLGECEQPFACPHGRPTVCSLDESTLAAGFERGSTRFR
ncbi:DNA mismatch repair endonuclease MutL [Halohasta litorea]|uniref:DNA mismatch repair protein MutL n=1 Tax=Halohasta litorea TaxID=869891 RepID=A0ABD6D4A7_9EURY|nr:DNA mismatch repair endonuclease MutL [Halohasta litorea]